MHIRELISRRSDLSTFIVHLTRNHEGINARQRLEAILDDWQIEARKMFGHAKSKLESHGIELDSQKCVCFTETPLEYLHLFFSDIANRECRFQPYGIAVAKKMARTGGVNPVWYVDNTPYHNWLTKDLDALIDQAILDSTFEGSPIARLTPFIERMGTGSGYRKEFWWEREWRHQGDYLLPYPVIGLCPENEIEEFKQCLDKSGPSIHFIDPRWSLERMIAHLAGFSAKHVDVF